MKTFRLFSMAALALVMAACSNNDDEIQQPAQQQGMIPFSATIAAPNSGATTRTTYTEVGTSINVAWKNGDQIALIHNGVKDVVTVGEPNTDGSAPVTGSITAPVSAEEDVVLVYPAASVDATGSGTGATPNAAYVAKGFAQDGTLEYIQNNLDARQGSGKIIPDGGSGGTLKEKVKMESKIAIWKLSLQDNAATPNALSATAVTVKVGSTTVAAAAAAAKSNYYLCLVPATMGSGDLTIDATVGSDTYTYTKAGGISLTANTYYQSTVSMTKNTTKNLSLLTNNYTAQDGDVLTGELSNILQISIADGATVTLRDVTIDFSSASNLFAALTTKGDARIILADGSTNTLKGNGHPGIYVAQGKTTTICGGPLGTGKLIASSSGAPGIGAVYGCGNIVIEGGDITATGGSNSTGIGGYGNISCGNITISGGKVNATSSSWGAGIGASSGTVGDILISGGDVTASSKWGAGIGAGKNGTCGNITISGGTVNATGGSSTAGGAAGIGSGYNNDESQPSPTCGNILITAGTVTAVGGEYAAGIGTGNMGNCGTIVIQGGTINATGGNCGAGIGTAPGYQSRNHSRCKSITISGGAITAIAGDEWNGRSGAGIGTGAGGTCGSITITDGVKYVDATKKGSESNDIGRGSQSIFNGYQDSAILLDDNTTAGTVTIASGVATSDGTKRYTDGNAANGYSKQ